MHLASGSNNLLYVNSSEPLLDIVLDILEFEPKPLAEIVQKLAEYGIISNLDSPSDDLSRIIDESDAIWGSASGLFNRTDKMLEGACLTHRLTSAEIENDLIDIVPDLDGLGFNLERIYVSDNQELRIIFREMDRIESASAHGSFLGPRGWLKDFSPGDLIAFRRNGETLSIFKPKEIYRGDEEQVALLRAFNSLYNNGRGVEPMEILLDAMCENPSLFRYPVPPIQELTQSLLLEPRGIWLGPVVEEWNTPDEAWQVEKKKKLAESLGFERCCTKEFDFALAAWKKWRKSKRSSIDYKGVLNALSHGDVATGFTSWVFQFETFAHRSVEAFMTDLVASGGAKAAGGYYVRAISRSLEGKAILAEKDLQMAIRHDPNFEPAKVELARYSADRGDIHAYIAALKQCKPGSVLSEIYDAELLIPRYPSIDRNEPCPCGSGLKYKSCCLKAPKLPTRTRIRWILQRVAAWISRPERQENLSDFFLSFNEMLTEPVEESYMDFIFDVATFEGGGIEQYLNLREELLSPSDHHLLEKLSSSRRALFEVIEIDQGHTLTLRDTLTGDRLVVMEALASLDSRIGDYLMGRVIEIDQGNIMVGHTMRIFLRQRDDLLELLRHSPEPFDFLRWLASTLKPLQILNFEGEEIIFCKAVISPHDTSNIASRLSAEFGEDENGRWIVPIANSSETHTETATVTLREDLVTIETSSVPRLEGILEKLKEVIGEFLLIDTAQHPINSTAENFTRHIGIDSGDEFDDEIRWIIDSHIEAMENRWLDEPIPALGGLTPKQALNDPTRREDLIRLLNEFERNELRMMEKSKINLTGFKASRIRNKLGLD